MARPRGSWRSPAGLGGDKNDSTPDSCQLPSWIRKRSKACGRPPPRSRGEGGMGLDAQIHCQRPGHLREAGPQRRRVRPAGSFRQRPCRARTWNPHQGVPGGRSRLEASQALWVPWARPSSAGPAPGPTDGVTGCRDRRNPAPQALLARGASPGHSPPNTHSPQAPRPPPGTREPAPRPPRQQLSSLPLGRYPGLWVTGGVRWRSLTPERHRFNAKTSPSKSAQLRSYIKKWGF